MPAFADKLRTLIAENLSQSELARRSGVSQKSISDYCSGRSVPSWKHVQLIARALKVKYAMLEDDGLVLPDPVPTPKRGRPRKTDTSR